MPNLWQHAEFGSSSPDLSESRWPRPRGEPDYALFKLPFDVAPDRHDAVIVVTLSICCHLRPHLESLDMTRRLLSPTFGRSGLFIISVDSWVSAPALLSGGSATYNREWSTFIVLKVLGDAAVLNAWVPTDRDHTGMWGEVCQRSNTPFHYGRRT